MSPEKIHGVDGKVGRHPIADVDAVKRGQFTSKSDVKVDDEWYNPGVVVAPTELKPTMPLTCDTGL